jgi:hypothetical protein
MRRIYLLALAALGVAACTGQDTAAVTGTTAPTRTTAPSSSQSSLIPFVNTGDTIFACPADSVAVTTTQTVGLAGGVIQFGPNTLIVPPGAVLSPTTITATTPADGHLTAVLEPTGLQFLVPPTLILNYSQCSPPPSGALSVAYLDGPLGQILQLLQTTTDSVTHTMSAPLSHFSVYAGAEARQ